MYIVNPQSVKNKKAFKGLVAKYILDQNIPILSQDGDIYYFADSGLLEEALSYAPLWVKVLMKITS